MAMACMQALLTISILFLASIRLPMLVAGSAAAAAAAAVEAPSGSGYRFELIHVDANGNFTREEAIRRAVNRSRLRAAMLAAEEDDGTNNSPAFSGSFSIPGDSSPYTYFMELKMGTLQETFKAVLDTGSEILWTKQMKMCTGSPSFSTTNASCADRCHAEGRQCNTCIVSKTYGGGKTGMKGFTGMETLALPTGTDKKERKVALACAIEWSNKMLPASAEGIVGLSRGSKSLVKQLGVTNFSYCLTENEDLTSPLWLDDDPTTGEDDWRSTPLVEISTQPESVFKDKYYVELDGICVGGKCKESLEQEYFKYKSQHKGLMMVDSGTTYTHLDTKIFEELKKLLWRVLNVNVVLKTLPSEEPDQPHMNLNCFEKEPDPRPDPVPNCFEKEPGQPDHYVKDRPDCQPDLVLKFPRADMRVPWDKYVSKVGKESCLAIEISEKSILGSIQQHNVLMLYDLAKETLSFKGVDCSNKR